MYTHSATDLLRSAGCLNKSISRLTVSVSISVERAFLCSRAMHCTGLYAWRFHGGIFCGWDWRPVVHEGANDIVGLYVYTLSQELWWSFVLAHWRMTRKAFTEDECMNNWRQAIAIKNLSLLSKTLFAIDGEQCCVWWYGSLAHMVINFVLFFCRFNSRWR